MRTAWNESEDDALHGLPWSAQLIYLRALRPHMDYATGIVGQRRGISLRGLAETLHVEHGQGRRNAGDPSPKAVRHALELLEREGLIERIPADRQLIFRLPLADVDSSVSEKWGRRRADVGQTRQGTQKPSDDKASPQMRGRRKADSETEKRGTPPVSGIRNNYGAKAPSCDDGGNSSRFAEFWDAWPAGQRKRDRRNAEKAWKKHHLDAMADQLIADVERRAVEDQQWLRGFAPMPSTYLNGHRWEDELGTPAPAPRQKAPTSPRRSVVDDNEAAFEQWLAQNGDDCRVIEGVCCHDEF